jgi:hypothetical protein
MLLELWLKGVQVAIPAELGPRDIEHILLQGMRSKRVAIIPEKTARAAFVLHSAHPNVGW